MRTVGDRARWPVGPPREGARAISNGELRPASDEASDEPAQLSAIVESSGDAIIGNTLAGTITSWNRGAERLFGYTADQAIARDLRMLIADPREAEISGALDRARHGDIIGHVRWLSRHRSGSVAEISTTLSPIHDRHGAIVGVSAIGRDISALLAAQRELEQRQHQIALLLEHAEDSARHREQFIAILSHELRNPLAAVLNATTLLEGQPDADVVRCQRVIARQARHMKQLLDDVLDVSRIARGEFQLICDDIDLRASTNYSPRASTVRLVVTIERAHCVLRVIDHGVGIEPGLAPFASSPRRHERGTTARAAASCWSTTRPTRARCCACCSSRAIIR